MMINQLSVPTNGTRSKKKRNSQDALKPQSIQKGDSRPTLNARSDGTHTSYAKEREPPPKFQQAEVA